MASTATPLALRLFTDREEPRETLRRFFQRIKDGTVGANPDARPVLSFYGVSGVGKSTLLAKALEEFAEGERQKVHELSQQHLRTALVNLDVGTIGPDIGIARTMVRVRNRFNALGVPTRQFDALYALWANEEPDQGGQLSEQKSDREQQLDEHLSLVGALAGALGESIPGIGLMREVRTQLNKLPALFEKGRARSRFVDGPPTAWTQMSRMERMPALLAFDLLDAISATPQLAICVAVDGFERIQTRNQAKDAQWAFQAMVAEVLRCPDSLPAPDGKPLKGRIGFVFLGREKLRWAELYSTEEVRVPWAKLIEEHLELRGLAEPDARAFLLERVVPFEREEGRELVAKLISEHTDALLAAAAERLPDQEASYLPYYLDLGVSYIRNNASWFDPAQLGSTPAELQVRFLRSLRNHQPELAAAFRALALALMFDRETFAFLLKEGLIAGYVAADFGRLVGDDWSFVNPVAGTPGLHAFHRHMQQSLLADQTGLAEDREQAASILRALLRRQLERVNFATPAECGAEQLAAFDLATAMLREVAAFQANHEAGAPYLLPHEEIVEEALLLDLKFDRQHQALRRRPLLEWVTGLARLTIGEEHEGTLLATNNLALTEQALGELSKARKLLENVVALSLRTLGDEDPFSIKAQGNLAQVMSALGDFPTARALQEAALASSKRIHGEEDPNTLVAMHNLATTLLGQGDLAAGRALQESVLALNRRILGEEHPNTVTAMGILAAAQTAQGDLQAARTLQENVLELRRRILGNEHSFTLAAELELAWTLHALGDLSAARMLLETGLSTCRQLLGDGHPHTLNAVNMLAATLQDQGELMLARQLLESALPISRGALGENHFNTLYATNNLSRILLELDELTEARAQQEDVVPRFSQMLGEKHPNTLRAKCILAGILFAQNELPAARALQETVLAQCQNTLGDEHPDTNIAAAQLANTLYALGDLAAARALQEMVLATTIRIFGNEHFSTVRAKRSLISTLKDQGDLVTLKPLQEEFLASARKKLGNEHPDTLNATSYLAQVLLALGDLSEARRLQEEVLVVSQRVLGEEHPDSFQATQLLDDILSTQGDLDALRKLRESKLTSCLRMFGDDHQDTLYATNNLARTLLDMGEHTEALAVQEKIVPKFCEMLGEEHPNTLRAKGILAGILFAQDKPAAARSLQENVLDTRRRVLGVDHPDTLSAMEHLARTMQELGELTEAQALLEDVLQHFRGTLGAEHPDTRRVESSLAWMLGASDEYHDAAFEIPNHVGILKAHLAPLASWDLIGWINRVLADKQSSQAAMTHR